MNKIYDKIIAKEVKLKDNTIWYTAGCLCNSASSVLLLLFVTRILGPIEGGVFSIGWTICQLMITVGRFGTRNFQVSDVKKAFQFSEYFSSKLIYIILMLIGCGIYALLLQLNTYKTLISFLLTFLMVAEVFSDLFAGNFQFNDKLHISGKSTVVRIIGSVIIFLLSLMFTKQLGISILLSAGYQFLWLWIFDFQITKRLEHTIFSFNYKSFFKLTYYCLPICISAFLTIFITSVPKNAIELILDETTQTIYNIIFMPSSVINMLGMFVFLPMYGIMAKYWNEKNYKAYKKTVVRNMIYIICLTVFVLVCGYIIGIPILSFVYNIDLNAYKLPLLVLLLSGGLNCAVSLLNYLITVMRRQNIMLLIYALVSIITQMMGMYMVTNYGLLGASYLYLISIGLLCVLLLIVYLLSYKANKQNS